ncbi:MAG: SPOR domain-containing protein, partial [Rhodoplanes sp.]
VILGGKTAAQRNRQMASLLDVGFQGLDTTLADDMARPRVGLDMADVASPSPRSLAAASSSPASSLTGEVWGIQVGAFPNAAAARRAAQRAVAATRSLMADGVIHVEPAGGRKMLYQARIGNLGRTEASRACGVLKQKKFKCMVFKLKQPIAIAGATSQATFDRPLAKPQLLDDAMLQISEGEGISEGDGITERERITEGERKWGIQVGAYRSNQPALTMATMASATADELLRPGKIAVVKRKHGSRTVYLARVHGLTRSSAEAACAKLRQTAIDCLIIEVVDETQAGWDVGPVTADLGSAVRPEAGGSFDNSGWGIQVGAFLTTK